MQNKEIEHILSSVKFSFDHSIFYSHIFQLVSVHNAQKNGKALSNPILEEYIELSRRIDRSQLQESCSIRNVLRTRHLVPFLIDDKGEIDLSFISSTITDLRNHLYSLGPQRQYDAVRQEHILFQLEALYSQKPLQLLLKKCIRPVSHAGIDFLIRQTLDISPNIPLTDVHARRAVLSAWLCYLRQNVGSCFATAPAEIIQSEQPEHFLEDLQSLLATGNLKRTFGGIENSVPISMSWGSGDWKKPIVVQFAAGKIWPEVFYSPGLINALESIGYFEAKMLLKKKILQLKFDVENLVKKISRNGIAILTAEQIIRSILLQKLSLTEKQLKEYENIHQHRSISHILPSVASAKNGIQMRCSQFFHSFETAKHAFMILADNALLKTWEYTLASFSDIKYEFGRWNFYASLGLETNQPDGIGQCIYREIQEKLERANQKVEEISLEYERIFTKAKTVESRMRHVSSDKEVDWLRMEYQMVRNELSFLQEQRDEAQRYAKNLVNLYDTLYELYVDLFKDYFQEVYDADLQEIKSNPFDDSPAGFRLVYKHGRSNSSQWTHIYNHQQFIDALTSFFISTEVQIAHALEEKKIEKDLSEVVSSIIKHIQTKEFIESAFHRMAEAHKMPKVFDPLAHLDSIEKKPWVYTSGGTMNTLVSCYYRLEDKPKEVQKWVESEIELLVFFADCLKEMPTPFLDTFTKKNRRSMLMHSPTHAFLLQPLFPNFRKLWSNEQFTYTFVRDHFVLPAEMFVENLLLNDEMIRFLLSHLTSRIPENRRSYFTDAIGSLSGPLSPIFFREHIVGVIEKGERWQSFLSVEELDGYLYSALPLCPRSQIEDAIHSIFHFVFKEEQARVDEMILIYHSFASSKNWTPFVTAHQLQQICKAIICLALLQTATSIDYHLLVAEAAQKLHLAMPSPVIFADSNWLKDYFGFVVNPGTAQLELWRLDYTGSVGFPMRSWKAWLNGSRPDLKWGIYVKPFEYGQF